MVEKGSSFARTFAIMDQIMPPIKSWAGNLEAGGKKYYRLMLQSSFLLRLAFDARKLIHQL
jgi:hypothetical protein